MRGRIDSKRQRYSERDVREKAKERERELEKVRVGVKGPKARESMFELENVAEADNRWRIKNKEREWAPRLSA